MLDLFFSKTLLYIFNTCSVVCWKIKSHNWLFLSAHFGIYWARLREFCNILKVINIFTLIKYISTRYLEYMIYKMYNDYGTVIIRFFYHDLYNSYKIWTGRQIFQIINNVYYICLLFYVWSYFNFFLIYRELFFLNYCTSWVFYYIDFKPDNRFGICNLIKIVLFTQNEYHIIFSI